MDGGAILRFRMDVSVASQCGHGLLPFVGGEFATEDNERMASPRLGESYWTIGSAIPWYQRAPGGIRPRWVTDTVPFILMTVRTNTKVPSTSHPLVAHAEGGRLSRRDRE